MEDLPSPQSPTNYQSWGEYCCLDPSLAPLERHVERVPREHSEEGVEVRAMERETLLRDVVLQLLGAVDLVRREDSPLVVRVA